MKRYYLFIIGMILCLNSCKNSSTPTTIHDNLNSPVTTNVTNSFTFSVNANQFSMTSDNVLNFLSDSLVITLSSTSYISGQAIIVVSDSSSATIFSDTIKSNKVIAIAHLKAAPPKHCSFDISNLEASLAFVVVGQ